MLRKIDLIRLSLEFKLPTDGSVVVLRNRIRVYMNAHREILYRNPRYNPLFPKHRRPAHLPPPPGSYVPSSRAPSPAISDHSDSSTHSFASWNGIGNNDQHHDPHVHPPQLLPPVIPPHDEVVFHPPPSPSIPGSDPGSIPSEDRTPVPRKSVFLPYPFFLSRCISTPSFLFKCICTSFISLSPTLLWALGTSPYSFPLLFPSHYHGPFYWPGYSKPCTPAVFRLLLLNIIVAPLMRISHPFHDSDPFFTVHILHVSFKVTSEPSSPLLKSSFPLTLKPYLIFSPLIINSPYLMSLQLWIRSSAGQYSFSCW